jgi:hypothetical protein
MSELRRVKRLNNKITPELIRAVAGRVYTMLERDLRLERERRRLVRRGLHRGGR